MLLSPNALYFNAERVTRPASTLDDLLQHAEDCQGVAMVPRFGAAYWGIQAFGVGLFDDNGRFTLAGSRFAEWLDWLATAQSEPAVILHEDDTTMRRLFTQG